MFFSIQTGQYRPSTLTKDKDEKYHLEMARYCIGQAGTQLHSSWLDKIKLNKDFYSGKQWLGDEDLENFLKDDSGQERNRLALVQNVIRPMVEQYRGNAIRMTLNFRVKSISQQAINRRETALAKTLFYSELANSKDNSGTPNPFGGAMKQKMPLGDNEAETMQSFNNLYVDKYVKSMNGLLKFVSERSKFDERQVRVAEELAFSGLGVMKTFEYAGHQEFMPVLSNRFFFDRTAKEYDLSDAFFQGDIMELSTAEIFEQWPDLKDEEREMLENYSKQFSQVLNDQQDPTLSTINSGRVPVYCVYWRDGQSDEYGYVKDPYGYEYLTKINHTYDGEDTPRYTDKDLIESKSIRAKKLLKGKKKRRLYYDVLRCAYVIPREFLLSASSTDNKEKANDIVLDWGIDSYQETETAEYNTVKFPYKNYCWAYIDGEILSPIDDAIDPQRFINRIWSVSENQINNSRGSGTIIDESMVEDTGEVLQNMNESKPIFIKAKGRGIQNAVGAYDTTIKSGTMVMYNIIEAMKNSIQQTTGVNEALKGESTGSDQLVGVTQLLIQKGTLMQEPFYNAITMIFKQCYQSICTKGKRIYADNERNIAIAVGDEFSEVIKITKDMNPEDFRCFVKRENSDEILTNAGNQMLTLLFQMQLLDETRFSNLYGRSTPDEVASALRSYAKEKIELKKMAEKQAQAQQQELEAKAGQEQQMMEKAAFEAEAKADVKEAQAQNLDMNKEAMKGLAKLAPQSDQAKNMFLNKTKNLQI